MDRQEFAVIAAALRTYYSRYDLLPNEQAVSLWYDSLKDIPAGVLSAALKAWVVTEKWPPTIADLREKADSIVNGERPDWGLGWHEVQQAIQKYGYMQWEKAQESMNPITREAVRRIGWQSICESENPETIRAQFRQVYEICEKRESADRNLPPELKSMIDNLLSANSRPQLEGEAT